MEYRRIAYEGLSFLGRFKTVAAIQPQAGGTRVRFRMDYAFPAGWLGAAVGRIVAMFIRQPMEARASSQLKKVVEKELWKPDSARVPGTPEEEET